MTRLFSSFDLFLFNFILNPTFILIIILFLNVYFFSFLKIIISLTKIFLENFFYSLKFNSFSKVSILLVLILLVLIFSLNYIGVLPYNFALTSQLRWNLYFSLIFWIRIFSFFIFNNLKGFLSHMIPEGTPTFLTWFLFAIELIRNLIRPITLTVRLIANILAGHLLIILLFKLIIIAPYFFFTYIILNMVEIFVALIQAYIFCTIICLYITDLE